MTDISTGVDIRLAAADDAAALAELAATTFPLACPPGLDQNAIEAFIAEALSPARFTSYIADPARIVLHARLGGELAGYAMLVAGTPTDADVRSCVSADRPVELSKFYVRRQAHGGGVAPPLMAEAIRQAGQRSATGIWLGVNQQNLRAQAFYRRSGFEQVGVRQFRVGADLCQDFVMERGI